MWLVLALVIGGGFYARVVRGRARRRAELVRVKEVARDDLTALAEDVQRLEHLVEKSPAAEEAYNRALEPKRLEVLPGGHFTAYIEDFAQSSAAARDWFARHLRPAAVPVT